MKPLLYMALAAGIAGSTLAAPPADLAERVRRFEQGLAPAVLVAGEPPALVALDHRMTELKVPAVSIAVIHQGRIDWARGYGVTRVGGPPVTPDTLFQAASISKPVFALGVLHQVDAGKLDLDASVNTYLAGWKLPDNDFTPRQKVTLRRLLSHTAGLTVHGFPGYAAGAKLPTIEQILDGAPPANTAPIRVSLIPGTVHRYSGGGYTVAQLLLGDVTGQPLPRLMNDTVLAPLGMTRSTFEQPLPAARMGDVALPHLADGTPVPGGPHVYPEMAAAGLWTTPSDLARYALGVREALAGKSRVITASTARAMLTRQTGDHGIGPVVGGQSRKYFTHNGGNAGYRCVLVAYEDGEGAVVMTSGDNGGGLMYEVLRTLAQVYQWPDFGPAMRSLATVKPEVLDRLLGVYELEDQSLYVVRREGDKLLGNLIGDAPSVLLPSAKDELFARDIDVIVNFRVGTANRASRLEHRLHGWKRGGVRVDEARARTVLASVERNARRVREQKADPRGEPAIRKLMAEVAAGNPDYQRMSPQLAELTRQQLPGLQGWLGGLGRLASLDFQRVAANGADEYVAKFEKGQLVIEVGLDDAGHFEMINLR